MSNLSGIISDKPCAIHQRVFGMTTTAVLVEFFSTDWIEIKGYLNK